MVLPTPTKNSFGGIAFFIDQLPERGRPLPDLATNYSVFEAPFGGRRVVQLGADKTAQFQVAIRVPSGSWGAFLGKRKTTGSLDLLGVARTATLVDVTGIEDGNIVGWVHCTAVWLV